MAFVDTSRVASTGRFFETDDLSYLNAPLLRASLTLMNWVGEALYAEVLAETGTPASIRRQRFEEAEALLAVAEALPIVNRADTGRGITLTTTVSGMDGNKTTRFMNPDEMEKEIQRTKADAERMISAYLPVCVAPGHVRTQETA